MVRIGIIEDDSSMRKVTMKIIAKAIQEYGDVKCKEFESAEEFLQEKKDYDIIILDIGLRRTVREELKKKRVRLWE